MTVLKLTNISDKETAEFVNGVANTLLERFSKPLANGEITFPEAVKKAVEKYNEIQMDMSLQLLTGRSSYKRKMGIFSDLILDKVYNDFNK